MKKKFFSTVIYILDFIFIFLIFFLISGNWILVPNCGNHYEISPVLAPEYSAKKTYTP